MSETKIRRIRVTTAGVAAVAVGTALSLGRQGGQGALDTVWAEDGTIFLSEAVRFGPLHSLFLPYAGYLHLLPRLVAIVVAAVPAGAAAAALAVAAGVVSALVAVFVYMVSADFFPSRWCRAAVAAVALVMPVAQSEVPNSVCNLQWLGLYALFWALVWNPRGAAGRLLAGVVVATATLTSLIAVALVPLSLWRAAGGALAVRGRTGRGLYGWCLVGVLAAGLAIQVYAQASGPERHRHPAEPAAVLGHYATGLLPGALLGREALGADPFRTTPWLPVTLAWAIVGAVVLVAMMGRTRPHWPLAAAAAGTSLAVWVVCDVLNGPLPRYWAAPAMLIVAAVVAVLRPAAVAGTSGSWPWLAGFLVVASVACAVNYQVANPRELGPSWARGLAAARAECRTDGTRVVALRVSPLGRRLWRVNLTCAYVER